MEDRKQNFRHILLLYYQKRKITAQVRQKFCNMYGKDVLTEHQYQNWFAKFRTRNFDLENAPRSGRRLKADVDNI